MKRFLLVLLLIISTSNNLYSQNSTKFLADELFLEIQRKSINSEGKTALYSEYLKALESKVYNSETRAELTSRLFTFYQRQGLYSNFNKAYGKHKNELIKNSILSQLWKVKALEISGKYLRMLEASKNLLESSENKGSNTDKSDAYRMIALSKMYSNQKDSALHFSNMALNFAKRSDSKKAVALTFRDLSNIYAHFDMIGESTSTLLKLNTEAQRLKDDDLLCWSNLKIAERSLSVNSYRESSTYYRKSLNIADKNNFRFYKVQIYSGLAEVSLTENRLNQAIENITKGYKFINEKEESIYELKLKLVHSKYLIEKGYLSDAMTQLDEILESYNEIDSKEGKGNTYHLIGRTHFNNKKWANAKQSFITSKRLLMNCPQSIYRIMNYKFLGQVNAKQKAFEKAYENIKAYQKLIDDHSFSGSNKAINELTQMYSRELREYRIKEQERVINDQVKEKELLALKGQKQMSRIVLIIIILISTIIIVLFYLRHLRINQTNKEVEMAQTLLRTQMNPHFIFNAMSVIQSSLYENNPAKSSKFLVSFSRLIRLILENSPKEFITLETEIEILEKYLKTQKFRFENRFDYQINVPKALVFKKILIPPMITQPFVENAIEHGQLNTIENGQIIINILEKEEMLYVEISDNGVGIAETTKKKSPMSEHKSMAMGITNQRVNILNKKHKSKARIAISKLTEDKHSGTRVEIYLPLLIENINFDLE